MALKVLEYVINSVCHLHTIPSYCSKSVPKNAILDYFFTNIFLLHRIVHITRDTLVNPGQTAELICEVDANPITADTVKWTRDGFDFDGRTKITASGNKFYLNVINVTEADEGKFSCKVNNGIGDEVTNTTFLLVRRKYYDSFLYYLDIYELIISQVIN